MIPPENPSTEKLEKTMTTFESSIYRCRAGPAHGHARTLLAGAAFGLTLAAGTAVAAPPGTVPFGVYDPEGSFSQDMNVSIEHVFMPWVGVDLSTLATADAYARERDRSLLVTVEPWIWGETSSVETLRSRILSGRHDATMQSVCAALAPLQSPVTVRWGQEMDNPNGHFPWAMWEPEDHVAAYRRMVGACRSVAPDLSFMWSPAGVEGMQAYYPGDDVVDVIGLSVFGLQDYERELQGGEKTFTDVLAPRYQRAVAFGKPIVVAELGFLGDDAYLDDWYNAVRAPQDDFAELTAVIYFNRQEVWPWPNDFGLPDWRDSAQRDN